MHDEKDVYGETDVYAVQDEKENGVQDEEKNIDGEDARGEASKVDARGDE